MPPSKLRPKSKPLDPKGYYRLLKVSPEAGPDEVRLAYAMAKQNASGPYLKRIDEAYEVLKGAKTREAYDQAGVSKGTPIMKSPLTLIAVIAILIAVIVFLWMPGIRMRGKKFEAGQTLVRTVSGREFGTVIRVDPSHQFGNQAVTTGYLVELADSHRQVWLPAIDLQATCDAR